MTRGFERISGAEDVQLPRRSTSKSAGYDFFNTEDVTIAPGSQVIIHTGIKVYMQDDEALFIYPRSSIGIKKGLMLKNTTGIIDPDYYNNEKNEGEIMICLYNISDHPVHLEKGEKIAQGIFQKFFLADDIEKEERKGGIGSTGK